MKQKYDFVSPIQQIKNQKHSNNLEEFLDDDFTKQKIAKKKNRIFNLVIITILFLSLGGLAGFSYWQTNIGKNNKKSQVAGIQDNLVKNVISGDNFSLVLNEKTPDGFEMTKKSTQSPFFEQKNVVNSSFVKKIPNSGDTVLGIQIITSEYDSKLDQKTFAGKTRENLGNDWEILSENINLPGEVLLSKIQKKDKSQSYYTTVTQNYYYVISILTKNKPEYTETNRFVETLLPNLNLN